MKAKDSFEKIKEIINESKIEFNDGYYRVYDIEDLDQSVVTQNLKDLGYSVQNGRTVKDSTILINTSVTAWDGSNCPFFDSWETLFNHVSASYEVPSFFYVLGDDQSDEIYQNNITKLENYCDFRRLLSEIADHCEPRSGVGKGTENLLFLIEIESKVRRHEFPPVITWSHLQKMQSVADSKLALEKLKQSIALDDSQDVERRSSLRSAFNELAGSCNIGDNIFSKILFDLPTLYKKYKEHHEIFVHKFSVNKVLQEINQQDLAYTSKINEITASAQGKALTIPAALVAIGALMKIDAVIDGVTVIIGILITSFIVIKSLAVHSATFKHLRSQVKKEFKRYKGLSEDAEIRAQSQSTETQLKELIDNASTNVKYAKGGVYIAAVFAAIYVLSMLGLFEKTDDIAAMLSQIVR